MRYHYQLRVNEKYKLETLFQASYLRNLRQLTHKVYIIFIMICKIGRQVFLFLADTRGNQLSKGAIKIECHNKRMRTIVIIPTFLSLKR